MQNNLSPSIFEFLFNEIESKLLLRKDNDDFDIALTDFNQDLLVEISRESLYVDAEISNKYSRTLQICEFVLDCLDENSLETI
eukprot:CAMPEP_0116932596 /NCGR_PEP_ID=MMETSP0467-20121206/28535_1 /TAXON_ID=283647 /ORGANISM="Mesodinium pulex, Strain SPMC105" /LENGTH=82 /DNA_ID=CAMNT_0004613315 /DNA_START=681 /DNA_END=929 /DNA_ORIENTATION=-